MNISKEKLLKDLQKAQEEVNSILDKLNENDQQIVNIDLQYIGDQITNLIDDLEVIDDFEVEGLESDLDDDFMYDNEDDNDDNY